MWKVSYPIDDETWEVVAQLGMSKEEQLLSGWFNGIKAKLNELESESDMFP